MKVSLKPRKSFFSTLLISIAVILVWRGVWNLMDMYLFPELPVTSNLIGILLGVFILYLPDDDIKELM